MPPTSRPLPRFVAEPSHELEPSGRWREVLDQRFLAACEEIEGFAELGSPEAPTWFPERTYAGRVYVPAIAACEGGDELFGFVSFERESATSEPTAFAVAADFTSETAARNPGWKLDLNEEVIAHWRGPANATGELTLVWGFSLTPGGVAVTAELCGETADQCALDQHNRFTLVSLDGVRGLGDDLYLEVKLWNRRGQVLATESLYADN
jgi:hypothetical protein